MEPWPPRPVRVVAPIPQPPGASPAPLAVEAFALQDAVKQTLRAEFSELRTGLLRELHTVLVGAHEGGRPGAPLCATAASAGAVSAAEEAGAVLLGSPTGRQALGVAGRGIGSPATRPSPRPSPRDSKKVSFEAEDEEAPRQLYAQRKMTRNFMPLRSFRVAESTHRFVDEQTWSPFQQGGEAQKETAAAGEGGARAPNSRKAWGPREAGDGGGGDGGGPRLPPLFEPAEGGAASGGEPRRTATMQTERHVSFADHAMGLAPKGAGLEQLVRQASAWRRRGAALVQSTAFESVSMLMILGNVFFSGVQIDYMARHMLEDAPRLYRAIDLGFLAFFSAEIGLRLFVYRCMYFRMWGWGWNIFDLLLVAGQVVEEVLSELAGSNHPLPSGKLLRIVRILRAIRLVRIFHVMSFADELRLLASCIVNCWKSFFWASVLLFMITYVVGIYFTQITLYWRLGVEEDELTDSLNAMLSLYGTVPRSVFSVFQGLTGGMDWGDLADPLMVSVSPWMGAVFLLYIGFTILAVLNVVTGIFVQQAIDKAVHVQEKKKLMQASRLFAALDADKSGTIKFAEIEGHLELAEVQDFFRSIDVDVSEAKSLFQMLDLDNSGVIAYEEFLSGCLRLQGPAKAVDLVLVMRELKETLELASVIGPPEA